MKLSFQVQLDGDHRNTVLRLPPGRPALWRKASDYILDPVTIWVVSSREGTSGVTQEALLFILQVTDNTVGLRAMQATRGGGCQSVCTAHQQVTGGWIAASSRTARYIQGWDLGQCGSQHT